MIARALALFTLRCCAVGLLVLATLEVLDPFVGIPLILVVVFYGYNKMARQVIEGPLTRRERRRFRRDAHRRDMHELDRTLAEFARDDAHNRIGL